MMWLSRRWGRGARCRPSIGMVRPLIALTRSRVQSLFAPSCPPRSLIHFIILSDNAVLANLVQIPKWGSILLDVGEGTWGQLARRFGTVPVPRSGDNDREAEGKAEETGSSASASTTASESPAHAILRDIRCIFISHLHADHHMGLAKVLALRKKVRTTLLTCY